MQLCNFVTTFACSTSYNDYSIFLTLENKNHNKFEYTDWNFFFHDRPTSHLTFDSTVEYDKQKQCLRGQTSSTYLPFMEPLHIAETAPSIYSFASGQGASQVRLSHSASLPVRKVSKCKYLIFKDMYILILHIIMIYNVAIQLELNSPLKLKTVH